MGADAQRKGRRCRHQPTRHAAVELRRRAATTSGVTGWHWLALTTDQEVGGSSPSERAAAELTHIAEPRPGAVEANAQRRKASHPGTGTGADQDGRERVVRQIHRLRREVQDPQEPLPPLGLGYVPSGQPRRLRRCPGTGWAPGNVEPPVANRMPPRSFPPTVVPLARRARPRRRSRRGIPWTRRTGRP